MKKIFFSLFLIPAVALVSCSKILDQTPTDRYTDAQVWQDAYLIECHLDNLYAMSCHMIGDSPCTYGNSPVNVEFSSSWHWNYNLGMSAQGEGPILANTIADDGKYSEYGSQYNYVSLKKNGHLRNGTYLRWWSNAYYLNRQLNHFLENIDNSPVSEKDQLKSEARFLRAFNYFALVKRYGGVPLITKETKIDAPEEEMYPKRSTEKAIYDFVIDELTDLVNYLPDNPSAGRAGKGAAYTLLSRVALYAGCEQRYGTVALDGLNGIPAGGDKNYFQIAANAAKAVMNMGKYALYNNGTTVEALRNLFLVRDNCEQILVKRHQGSAGSVYRWSWDICNCPKPNAWGVGQYILPYYNLIEKFENVDGSAVMDRKTLQSKPYTMEELWGKKDPRFHAWFWTNGVDWTNGGGANGSRVFEDGTVALWSGVYDPEYNEGTVSNLAPHVISAVNQIYDRGGKGPVVDVSGNQMLEQLRTWGYSNRHTGFGIRKLLDPTADNKNWFCCSTTDYPIFRYAEVLLNYAEAQAELDNQAEAKNTLNVIRARAGMPAAAAGTVAAVRHEREIEMCFENQRYWDLRRWHIAYETLNDKPNQGIAYILDYPSMLVNGGAPKFWVEIKDKIDAQDQNPKFPENNYYMPIGDGTIAINTNLVENPGY